MAQYIRHEEKHRTDLYFMHTQALNNHLLDDIRDSLNNMIYTIQSILCTVPLDEAEALDNLATQ